MDSLWINDNLWIIYGYGWWYTYSSVKYEPIGMEQFFLLKHMDVHIVFFAVERKSESPPTDSEQLPTPLPPFIFIRFCFKQIRYCPATSPGWWLTYPSENYESQLG